jgi:hypothetical protein
VSDWNRSIERQKRADDNRRAYLSLAFTKRGEGLTEKYYPQLANRIAEGLRDFEIRRALLRFSANLDNVELAIQLLVAGINVCDDVRFGIDKDGNKTFRDQAIWIGYNFGVREDESELTLKVGAWGSICSYR